MVEESARNCCNGKSGVCVKLFGVNILAEKKGEDSMRKCKSVGNIVACQGEIVNDDGYSSDGPVHSRRAHERKKGAYRIKMNVQAHMSVQIAGQLPNQARTQLPGVPQQNESPFSNQIQNLGGDHNTMYVDPQLAKARKFMQEKIYELLIQRQQQPHDRQPKQYQDFVRRLDEVLFRNAASKGSLVLGEYMNLETLETRLHVLIKRLPMSNRNQHHPQLVNAPSPIATMIPTPRMTHSGN